jgi:hypothetical protein
VLQACLPRTATDPQCFVLRTASYVQCSPKTIGPPWCPVTWPITTTRTIPPTTTIPPTGPYLPGTGYAQPGGYGPEWGYGDDAGYDPYGQNPFQG